MEHIGSLDVIVEAPKLMYVGAECPLFCVTKGLPLKLVRH